MTLLREEPHVGGRQSAVPSGTRGHGLSFGKPDKSAWFSGDWLGQAGAEEDAWASLP